MRSTLRKQARKRLDQRLQPLHPVERFQPPPKGWMRAIREALGMTRAQLGTRLDVRPQTVETIEKSEERGAIQLATLRRAAEALGCTLVYALVPDTSLQSMVDTRARQIAIEELQRVAHTMKLEDQGTGEAEWEERIESYIRSHLKERDLWRQQ